MTIVAIVAIITIAIINRRLLTVTIDRYVIQQRNPEEANLQGVYTKKESLFSLLSPPKKTIFEDIYKKKRVYSFE